VEADGRRSVIVTILSFALLVAMLAGALAYNRYQATQARERALSASQHQDYALCVAQNQARVQTRRVAASTYALVAGVLKNGGPDDPELRKVFLAQNRELGQQLKALRPLDCATYVSPDIPPDQGVD
jgi:hypothetical protein